MDGVALAVRQPIEGDAHLLGHGEVPRKVLDVVVGRVSWLRAALLPRRASGLGAHEVDGAVVGDGDEVGAQTRSGRVELLRLAPQPQEGVLGHLVRQKVGADHALGQRAHGAAVAAVGLGERRLVVPADGDDQRGVARRREVDPHRVPMVTARA